jgi:tetratricopeptide (TPR) repeat protein
MATWLRWLAVAGALLVAPALADQRDPKLDELFNRLHASIDQAEADRLEREIWDIWYHHDSGQVALLMVQGRRAMAIGDFDDAESFFTEVIEKDPQFAEGWNRRATLYYLMGRYQDSIADVSETLALEPRHFGALSGMGLIYTALKDEATALAWFEKALEANPHMVGVRYQVEQLKKKLAGEPT